MLRRMLLFDKPERNRANRLVMDGRTYNFAEMGMQKWVMPPWTILMKLHASCAVGMQATNRQEMRSSAG